ncbi:hypothetical protein ACIBEJ_24620 [Nonomuraea sp. NPDC050790]|uniref:hypothetical protein n=1 Tax=Nonomuraea sp. NPDC050790 TaxID=3364371 RepID=UPI0037BB16D7
MSLPRRTRTWIWAGRIVFLIGVIGLVSHLASVGLEKADSLGSVVGALAALGALVAPYLLPAGPAKPEPEGPEPQIRRGIDLRHAQGVQISESGNNVMHNNFWS